MAFTASRDAGALDQGGAEGEGGTRREEEWIETEDQVSPGVIQEESLLLKGAHLLAHCLTLMSRNRRLQKIIPPLSAHHGVTSAPAPHSPATNQETGPSTPPEIFLSPIFLSLSLSFLIG